MRKIPKKIELASQSRLLAVEHLAPRFFREVLAREFNACLVTDESDLRDFVDVFGDRDSDLAAMFDRIEGHYLMDGREAGSSRIVDLLEFLESRGVRS
jgi:hypothetical protein